MEVRIKEQDIRDAAAQGVEAFVELVAQRGDEQGTGADALGPRQGDGRASRSRRCQSQIHHYNDKSTQIFKENFYYMPKFSFLSQKSGAMPRKLDFLCTFAQSTPPRRAERDCY